MGLGLAPPQVRLATLVSLLLSLVLGVPVLVSNVRTWRAVRSSSSLRVPDLHMSLLYITTALAAASIVSGLVGFFGTSIVRGQACGLRPNTPLPNQPNQPFDRTVLPYAGPKETLHIESVRRHG